MNLLSTGNTLVNNMNLNSKNLEGQSDSKNDNFNDELLGMIELSVKSTKLPDNLFINGEVKLENQNKESESFKLIPYGNGDFLNLSDLEKLKEIAKKIKLANNINQGDNIGKNLILNLNTKNKLFQEVDLSLIKKQNDLLEKYGNLDVKVDLLEHPKVKLIRETTKDLIAQHREFLQSFKEKLGITNGEELIANNETEPQIQIKEIKESNKLFFENLRTRLNNNVDSNLKPIENSELVSTIKEGLDGGNKFGMENNNLNSGENSTKNSETLNSKKLIELFMNGKISSESFNKNLSELKQISNEIKANAKEYLIYKDIQASNIMTNTVNSVRELAPNGSAIIRMNLNPENLGKVFVELNVINNVANLNFKSASKETIKLIEHQINNLVEKLNNQGISTESISVSLNSEDEQELLNQNKFFEKNGKEQRKQQEYLDTLKSLAQLAELKS
jgi:flagellar hook-length control protein FliK